MAIIEEDVVDATIVSVANDSALNRGIETLRSRRAEFSSTTEMLLTGLAAVPQARALLDDRLEAIWADAVVNRDEQADEVVIGGGLHAAVYCATRVRMGFPKPLVLERGRVGGAFAMSRRPSFYLNSRNRPGPLGLPGESRGLNYLPGAHIQPANLSASEFQTNADLAWVVRVTLGQFAEVRTGATVVSVVAEPQFGRSLQVELSDGRTVCCDRVIDARGLGDPNTLDVADGERIKTFPQMMAAMDTDFPLRGLKRVAVVGTGDAARCAVEALLGMGPAEHMSAPVLDFVETVDWYGPGLPRACEEWRQTQRWRYQAIGSALKQPGLGQPRVRVLPELGNVSKSLGAVYVNDRLYDLVVVATGYSLERLGGLFADSEDGYGSQPTIATQYSFKEAYAVGPAANLPFSSTERTSATGSIEANRAAIFRLAGRTAALAARLPRLSNLPF